MRSPGGRRRIRAGSVLAGLAVIGSVVLSRHARADVNDDVFSDEQRLEGFREHQKDAESFDQKRLSGLEEYKRNKKKLEQSSSPEAIADYKQEKAKESELFREGGPAYKKDLLEREATLMRIENLRLAYVRLKALASRRRHEHILLTDAQEYGLNPHPDRVDYSNRLMYGGKALSGYVAGSAAKNGGGSSASSPGNSFSPPPDFNTYEPPPPPIPFDDNPPPPPPPMFDEPEF